MARNVESIAVNETSAWYICDGRVHVQKDLTLEKPYNEESIKIDFTPEKPYNEQSIIKAAKLSCFGHVSNLMILTVVELPGNLLMIIFCVRLYGY